MNAVLTMRKLGGDMDGYCGNFNCLAEDDTLDELAKRGLAAPLAMSSFPEKAPASQTKPSGEAPKTLNDCAPELLKKAEESCAGAQGAMKEDCMFDVCASGSAETGAEDVMTEGVGEEMEAKFSFMGVSLPSLAVAGISPQMQWMLVLGTTSFGVAGFVSGAFSRRLRGSGMARAGGFARVAEDEEEALLMPTTSWEHQPIHHHGESDLEA